MASFFENRAKYNTFQIMLFGCQRSVASSDAERVLPEAFASEDAHSVLI
jgi:hypothetical protein